MIDITPIVQAIVALMAALITAFVIPYIKGKTTAQQQEDILMWIRVAVAAAEQLYRGFDKGTEKKQYVINFLKQHGYSVDDAAIDAMIESCVYKLNTGLE